jgi:hypothetical protein
MEPGTGYRNGKTETLFTAGTRIREERAGTGNTFRPRCMVCR